MSEYKGNGPIGLRFAMSQQEGEWLEEKITCMSIKEKMILVAVNSIKRLESAADLINVIAQLDCYTLYYPVGNDRELGKFAAKYLLERINPDAFAYLDFQKIGRQFRERHKGIYSDGGYVCMECPMKQIYTGENLHELKDDFAIHIKLGTPFQTEPVWLSLPDYEQIKGYPDEVRIALDALGVNSLNDCRLIEVKCGFPYLGNPGEQYTDLNALVSAANNFGYVLDEQNQGMPHFMEHFQAALEYENCTRLDFALDISQNLHCYDFFPAYDLSGYGEKMAKENNLLPNDPVIVDAFDYEEYGTRLAIEKGVRTTPFGLVVRNNHEFVCDFCSPEGNSPEQGMNNFQL